MECSYNTSQKKTHMKKILNIQSTLQIFLFQKHFQIRILEEVLDSSKNIMIILKKFFKDNHKISEKNFT